MINAKRGVSLAPQNNSATTAQSSRKTIASAAEDKISDSFQELIEEELMQNELKDVAETPMITKRGVSLAPQNNSATTAQSSRTTIASAAEDKISDSFQELIEQKIIEDQNISDVIIIENEQISCSIIDVISPDVPKHTSKFFHHSVFYLASLNLFFYYYSSPGNKGTFRK